MSFDLLTTDSRATAESPHYNHAISAKAQAAEVAPYFRWKAAIDVPVAAILLLVFAPVIGVLWLIVKITSPGPGFYRQERVGKGGRTFMMVKLRSMRQDAEVTTGAIWCATNDSRVTRFGEVLRKYHLDELPQLFNVLRGEMSLVGPRPERPEFVDVLATKLDSYCERLAVPPGITGLAQLNLPPDTDLDSVARKIVLDQEYVRTCNLWLEARLLFCTATRLFKVPTIRLMGLHRTVNLEAIRHESAARNGAPETDSLKTTSCHKADKEPNGNGHLSMASTKALKVRSAIPTKPR